MMPDSPAPSASREASIQSIFGDALEVPPDQRPAFLEQACAGDAMLRGEVEALLAAARQAGAFLSEPAATLENLGGDDLAGTRIGRYTITGTLGEGGFGTVYRASQDAPMRREVAIKVIKLGMDTKQVIARFDAERQALAILDHPSIARVFDAGTTASGRPYFVMELVDGVPITNYCDRQNLSARQRLELFVLVCRALQHAHQKGIIHRDIKPNNVLIVEQGGVPVPKIIDFGIAKATATKLTDRTLLTEARQLIGTPAYMSPEQAGAERGDVDTRSDVYSMGVLLYELLTGTTPIEVKSLHLAAYEQMRQIIREFEPPVPSARVTKLGDAAPSIAATRSIDPKAMSKAFRGEIDWIVMRCLEKPTARRYQSAEALCDDIERHLRGDTVLARPPTRNYRLRKYVAHHAVAISVAVIIAAALITALVVSRIALVRERQALQLAQVANESSTALVTFAITRSVGDTRGEQLFSEAYRRVRDAYGPDHPMSIIAERNFGTLLNGRGRYVEGEARLRDAYGRACQVLGPSAWDTIAILPELIHSLTEQGRLDDALIFNRKLDAAIRGAGVDPELRIGYSPWLGGMLTLTHRYAEARAPLLEALKLEQESHGSLETVRGLMENIAEGYEGTGDHENATHWRREIGLLGAENAAQPNEASSLAR